MDVLAHYLDGRLSEETRAELDEHLATGRSTVSLLASLRNDDLPSELRDSVGAFLRARTEH